MPGEESRIRDRYRVIRMLAEGSSGRTLLCEDANGERVAVKELDFRHLADWKSLELFEREAKVLTLLDHPGIPKVLDFFQGQDESTTHFIVQEYIEGASLAQRMESGPMLGQREVRDVALGILDVLEYLHGRAPPVLHRDIKPSNILIRPDGSVALVDFGGVYIGLRGAERAAPTVVGTFGYMPPEQLVGQAGPRSDLYALGATLLHVVTGKPPGEFPFDAGRIEIPTDLPTADGLARLIEALLRPAPRDRPQSAAQARRILTDPSAAQQTSMVRVGEPRRPARRQYPPITSGEGPRFVDMGQPPRDVYGRFHDVYWNLINPLFPPRRLWSAGVHAVWVVFACFLSIMSIGFAPMIYGAMITRRSRKYAKLFCEGEFTHGVIVSAEKGAIYATLKYEYEVAGETFIGAMEYAQEMTEYWDVGDTVPVLYDRNDPRNSCFVYR